MLLLLWLFLGGRGEGMELQKVFLRESPTVGASRPGPSLLSQPVNASINHGGAQSPLCPYLTANAQKRGGGKEGTPIRPTGWAGACSTGRGKEGRKERLLGGNGEEKGGGGGKTEEESLPCSPDTLLCMPRRWLGRRFLLLLFFP